MTKTRTDPGLVAALLVAGSVKALAKKVRRTESAVSQWTKVPPEMVLVVEKVTGISRHKLRPDLHGSRAPRRPDA